MRYQPVTTWELARYRSARRGVKALHDVILFLWGNRGARTGGIYNRRRARGGTSWSLHAVGRAGDIMCNRQVGDEIFLRLIHHAEALGVCEVIWNRKRWTPEHGVQDYNGENPHTDHVHFGLTIAAADNKSDLNALHQWDAAVLMAA